MWWPCCDVFIPGLAGGSYFRTAAVLDAFSDEALAEMDWDFFLKHDSHRVFSSDFAMPLALSLRGYTYGPWKDIRQVCVQVHYMGTHFCCREPLKNSLYVKLQGS